MNSLFSSLCSYGIFASIGPWWLQSRRQWQRRSPRCKSRDFPSWKKWLGIPRVIDGGEDRWCGTKKKKCCGLFRLLIPIFHQWGSPRDLHEHGKYWKVGIKPINSGNAKYPKEFRTESCWLDRKKKLESSPWSYMYWSPFSAECLVPSVKNSCMNSSTSMRIQWQIIASPNAVIDLFWWWALQMISRNSSGFLLHSSIA